MNKRGTVNLFYCTLNLGGVGGAEEKGKKREGYEARSHLAQDAAWRFYAVSRGAANRR